MTECAVYILKEEKILDANESYLHLVRSV